MDEEYEVEDLIYAERNVLQEEATTVEAETITVDKFRQRFCHTNTIEKSPSIPENTHLESHPKYKAPPPPPRQRRSSSSSNTFKVCFFGTLTYQINIPVRSLNFEVKP